MAPVPVVRAVEEYWYSFPSCHGRAAHAFARRTTDRYDEARRKVQRLVRARHPEEVVFTRNATEGINWLAASLPFEPGDTVLASDLEHNSNLLPWQRLAARRGVRHRVFATRPDGTFDAAAFEAALDASTRLVTVTMTSNVTGTSLPVERIVETARGRGVPVLVDAVQALAARRVDVQALGVDFAVMSLHKAYGPTGVGILYCRRDWFEHLEPPLVGGGTVDDSTYESSTPAPLPERFEAGLQNYAGVVGAGAAAEFLSAFGERALAAHQLRLNAEATEGLSRIPGVSILGPADPALRGSIVNFTVAGMPSHDVARLLDSASGVMVRSGKHCCHSWYNARGIGDSVRASFGVYNDAADVRRLLDGVRELARFFQGARRGP
jgi:cysteine desulfurase/selenocysteine lyase